MDERFGTYDIIWSARFKITLNADKGYKWFASVRLKIEPRRIRERGVISAKFLVKNEPILVSIHFVAKLHCAIKNS